MGYRKEPISKENKGLPGKIEEEEPIQNRKKFLHRTKSSLSKNVSHQISPQRKVGVKINFAYFLNVPPLASLTN